MTSGTYYDDFTSTVSGIPLVGRRHRKTWSGTDSPKRVKLAPSRVIQITRGKKVYKVRIPAEYGPKRSRSAEHPYSCWGCHLENTVLQVPVGGLISNPSYAPNGSKDFQQQVAGDFLILPATILDANDQIKLVNKLNEAVQGSDFNMSVFLGEGHQTLELIADSARRIAKAGMLLKKGNVLGAAHRLLDGTGRKVKRHRNTAATGSIGSASWLELQYGWLPLLSDCKSAAEALAHQLSAPCTNTYRVSVRKELSGTRAVTGYMPYFNTKSKWSKTSRRSLIARISEGPSALAQLGLLNPEVVAWELVPFSFVVDWFIPIGSYLSARAAAQHLTGLYITSDKTVYSDNPVEVFGPCKVFGDLGIYSRTYRFDRTVSNVLDVPMPTFKGLEKAASWQHCANALALLTQVFLGRKKP